MEGSTYGMKKEGFQDYSELLNYKDEEKDILTEEILNDSMHENITIKVEPNEVWFNMKEEHEDDENIHNEEELNSVYESKSDFVSDLCQEPLIFASKPGGIVNDCLKMGMESRENGYSATTLKIQYEAGLKYCIEHTSFTREGERFFGCYKCPFVTSNEEGFKSHFWCHFEGLEMPLDVIGKQQKPRRRKNPLKMFYCDTCEYSTNRKDTLKVHQLKHSDDKPLKCEKCDYRTNRKDTLKIHSLKHSDMKLWKCDSCEYETNHKSELRIHSLKHNDTKLFRCDQCPYETNRKSHLKGHSLTHSASKRFKCSECAYATNQKSNLKGHMLVHTEVKLFKCLHCEFETNQKTTFNRHLLRNHSVNP